MRSRWVIAAILFVISVASSSAQQSPLDARQEIKQMAKTFSGYYNNQNAAAIATIFTKDALLVSPGLNAVSVGSKAIEDALTRQFTIGFSNIERVVDQISVLGTEAAISSGRYRVAGQGQSGLQSVDGNWTEVEVHEQGIWKIRLLTLAPKPAPNEIPPGLQANSDSPKPQSNSEGAGTFSSDAKKSTVLIDIDKSEQTMTVSLDGRKTYEWPVSTGRAGYSTPSGPTRPPR